jgi:competence protein ComEC
VAQQAGAFHETMARMRLLFVPVVVMFVAACPRPRPPPPPPPPPTEHITWKRAETTAAIPREPPPAGSYRIHLIDVGTGLALLVQGADFAMLFDAGTNDREEKPSRVIAYLAAALGPSGDGDLCGNPPAGAHRAIDHIVLSHPHFDHASALDTVLHCYEVKQFWDSGRINDTVFYRELVSAIANHTGLTYHTAASVPDDHSVTVKDLTVQIPTWQRFSEGDVVALGEGARFTILHAEGKAVKDINGNSIVVAVELGPARLLLTGDAPSGARQDPSSPPGEVEAFLLDQHRDALHADILQVGHHGSKTSSRHDFVAAVAPTLALVSSGPKVYGSVVLPDKEILEELDRVHATVLRTDERDAACPVTGRVGGDSGPGGCDSWIITITP